jgi:CheY-like chemotaxis protein
VESCRDSVHERGHRIAVHLHPDAVPVSGDAVRLEQIVCNLLNNAAKFSVKPSPIDVTTSAVDGSSIVVVEDKGVGFDASATDRIFAPFGQSDATIDRSAGGLGMGLTIVKRLAELHGGSVHAFSGGQGKGARFEVRIPIAADATLPKPQRPAKPRNAMPLHIVVIEDNADIRETMRMLLAMWGHHVAMAPDGVEGLQLVLKERPDVALIDVGLPRMNGYDLARRIREDIPDGTPRLIAVTGYGQPADRTEAARAGFDAHLLKPIDPDMLEGLLASVDRRPA